MVTKLVHFNMGKRKERGGLMVYSYGKPQENPQRLSELLEEEEEARRLREKAADWEFINKQPPKVREALILYVRTGDLWRASKLAGLKLEEFDELRERAKIPKV